MPKKRLDEILKKHKLSEKDREIAKKEYQEALEIFGLEEGKHLDEMLSRTAKFSFDIIADLLPERYQEESTGATISLEGELYILIDEQKYKRGDYLHEAIHYLKHKEPEIVKEDVPHAYAYGILHGLHTETLEDEINDFHMAYDLVGFNEEEFQKSLKGAEPLSEENQELREKAAMAAVHAYRKEKTKKKRVEYLKKLLSKE